MKKLGHNSILWGFLLQAAVICGILAVCQHHDIWFGVGIKYFLFQLFNVLIPGTAIFLLFDIKIKDSITAVGIGYSLGLIFLVIEYLVLISLGLQLYSFFVSGIFTIISVVIVYKKKCFHEYLSCPHAWTFCLGCITLILLLGIFAVSDVNTIPEHIDSNGYYVDWLFWTGNNISLTKGFPPQDFRLCGETFNYHYFSSIIIAQSFFITKIDIGILSFYFSFIIPAISLVTVAYTLLKTLIKTPVFMVLSLIIILFTNGSSLTYIWHIYFCPFGYDYGYIFGMLSFYFLLGFIDEEKISLKRTLLSSFSIFMTTGCKGPVAVVVLMGFAVAAFYKLVQKKYKDGLLLGMIWLGTFLITYFIFISGNITASDSGLKFLGIKGAFKQNPYAQNILNTLTAGLGFPNSRITKGLALILYIYNTNKAAILLLIVVMIYSVICLINKKSDIIDWIVLGIGVWGICITILTRQSGGSEMYFIMSIIPFCVLGGFYVLERIKKSNPVIVRLVVSMVLIAGDLNLRSFMGEAYQKARQGVLCINNQNVNLNYNAYYVTNTDYNAYLWLKNNTKDGDIIAIDYLFDINNQTQQMAAGVFSERYIWNDGKYAANILESERRTDVMERFLDDDPDAFNELRKSGVTYFMQNMIVNPDFTLENEFGTEVFENESFRIYHLR